MAQGQLERHDTFHSGKTEMITQDQIIEWAYQEGLQRNGDWCFDIEGLTNFANLVAQHQKEQDARICVEIEKHLGIASECATAIRNQNELAFYLWKYKAIMFS